MTSDTEIAMLFLTALIIGAIIASFYQQRVPILRPRLQGEGG